MVNTVKLLNIQYHVLFKDLHLMYIFLLVQWTIPELCIQLRLKLNQTKSVIKERQNSYSFESAGAVREEIRKNVYILDIVALRQLKNYLNNYQLPWI